ncbi:Transcription initiation factor TFIID subunit 9B [Terramyces sp. JEL0728]|nr:Transcription initiation factor TFIID subunit 9B [Terramyces sp. JEL0728]
MFEAFQDPNELPPTARLISLILQGASVEDYEPRVLAQLYEVAHSYILNVLQDAQLYADHAEHKELSVADVKLAIETRATLDFTNPPSRQALLQLAQKKNSIPLPLVPEKLGLRLPPERHCLIRNNISINPKKRVSVDPGNVAKKPAVAMPTPAGIQIPVQPITINSNIANADDDYDME